MELLYEQCVHNESEKPCEECVPKEDREESPEYDYDKRLWF